jgi:hypothetical protein
VTADGEGTSVAGGVANGDETDGECLLLNGAGGCAIAADGSFAAGTPLFPAPASGGGEVPLTGKEGEDMMATEAAMVVK